MAGYTYQRATATSSGRIWEAWFTRTAPIPDGPYKFSGRPSFLAKVDDTHSRYLFGLTQLRRLAPPVTPTTPEAGAKPIAKAGFGRGKTTYDHAAM